MIGQTAVVRHDSGHVGAERDHLGAGERGDVDKGTSRCDSAARARASAITRRPSASVFSTSTVIAVAHRDHIPGRCAVPLGMFSAQAR